MGHGTLLKEQLNQDSSALSLGNRIVHTHTPTHMRAHSTRIHLREASVRDVEARSSGIEVGSGTSWSRARAAGLIGPRKRGCRWTMHSASQCTRCILACIFS